MQARHPITHDLTIAINGYKNPVLLRQCIQSIQESLADSPLSSEIIACDSATEDDTKIMMRQEFPELRFFPFEKNVGFKTLFNTGLLEAQGEFVFSINSDVLMNPGVVEELIGYLREHADVGIVAPRQKHFNGRPQQSAFRFYRPLTIIYRRTFLGKTPFGKKHLRWFMMTDTALDKPTPVDWVIGSAMLVRREVALEQIGLMDDRFFMYMEDVDWCRRFWAKNLKVVYYPYVEIYHYHAKGSAKGGFFVGLLSNRLVWYHIHSALQYFWKYRFTSNPRVKNHT